MAWAIVAGMALTAVPTLMTMSAAYHYYLVSAGWAALLAMWAKQLWFRRPRLAAITITCIAGVYLGGLWMGGCVLHSAASIEHEVRDSVMSTDPSQYPKGTRLFFINLPLTSMEAGPAIRLASNRPDLDFCPLTLSTSPFVPDRNVTYQLENERTLLVKITGPGAFSGQFGEEIGLGWFGSSRRDFQPGPVKIAPFAGSFPFRVEVVEADSQGIKALRFIFDKPVNDPGYRFFVGTTDLCAQRLRFDQDGDELPSPPPTPQQIHIMRSLRRTQIANDTIVDFLARCP